MQACFRRERSYVHPPTLVRGQEDWATQCKCMESEFVDLVLKTGGSAEALMQAKT